MAQRNSSKRVHLHTDNNDEPAAKRHHAGARHAAASVPTNDARSSTGDVFNVDNINGSFVGGRYNTNTYNVNVNTRTQAEVPEALTQATAHSAFHNSKARGDPPRCHPNTRVAIQKKILNWVRGLDPTTKDFAIMWLYGPAGSGKTAIAQTIAEMLDKLNILLASFFFARLDPSRNCSHFLVATIAYQIAQCLPDEVAGRIYSAASRNPHLFQLSLEKQIVSLLVEPLRSLLASGYFFGCNARVVIIDGLDECIDRNEQEEILRSLSAALLKHRLPICFLIASRPELEIMGAFNSETMKGVSTRLALENDYQADSDIKRFLSDEFKKIKRTHMLRDHLPTEWPTYETMLRLVRKSSGQFIYASTVVKFVKSPRHHPDQRLRTIFGLRPPGKDLPFADLDALYHHLFSTVADWEKVSLVLAFCMLRTDSSDFSVDVIEAVLCLEPGDCRLLLCDLGSIIDVDETPLRRNRAGLKFYHASLQDFLLDKSRSKEFHIDPAAGHARLIRVFSQSVSPREWKVAGMDRIDLTILRPHIELAHGSQNVEAEILSFDFLRFFGHEFPPHVAHSIPDYLSIIKNSRLEGATAIYRKQEHAFYEHLKKKLRGYGEGPFVDFFLLCICSHDFFGAYPNRDDKNVLRFFPPMCDSLWMEAGWAEDRSSYIQALKVAAQEIISEQSERQTVTSAALYASKEASVILAQKRPYNPSRSLVYQKERFFLDSCDHLLEQATRSEDLIDYAQDLAFQPILDHHPGDVCKIDTATHNYLTRMGIESKQDYTFLSCHALTRLSKIAILDYTCTSEDDFGAVIKAFVYLLEKAGKSEDLVSDIQKFPMPLVLDQHPWAVKPIDKAFKSYLRRMGIASKQDYASLSHQALMKVSTLVNMEEEYYTNNVEDKVHFLIQSCQYLVKKASPSREFIDFLQGFQRHFLRKPGYLNKTWFVELGVLIYGYLAGTDKAVSLDNISSAYIALQSFDRMSRSSKDGLFSIRHCFCDIVDVADHCKHMLEKAGQFKKLGTYVPDERHSLYPLETRSVEDALKSIAKEWVPTNLNPLYLPQ